MVYTLSVVRQHNKTDPNDWLTCASKNACPQLTLATTPPFFIFRPTIHCSDRLLAITHSLLCRT